jgi:hypothetical protein
VEERGGKLEQFSSAYRPRSLEGARHPERSEGPGYFVRSANAEVLRFPQNDGLLSLPE